MPIPAYREDMWVLHKQQLIRNSARFAASDELLLQLGRITVSEPPEVANFTPTH
jgi:hypothetical protein